MSKDTRAVSLLPANTRETRPTGVRYSADVQELAFLCWVDADASVERAHRAMVEKCSRADPEEDYPLPSELPDVETVRRWVDRLHWKDKLALAVDSEFPLIRARQKARLVMMTDRALDTYAKSMAGVPITKEESMVAKDILALSKLDPTQAHARDLPASDDEPDTNDPLADLERHRRQQSRGRT